MRSVVGYVRKMGQRTHEKIDASIQASTELQLTTDHLGLH
jgi:hypothetical protein